MPIFYQEQVDDVTRLAIWKIEEEESFFAVPVQREITHPHKRQQHLAGRYLLHYLFPDFPIDLIKIADTRKPFLEDEAYHFSISHCSHYAAAIVSKNKRVGVDIEVPTPKVEKIRHKFLHAEELQIMNEELLVETAQVDKMAPSGFVQNIYFTNPVMLTSITKLTLLWSAKEAIFKWWSYGNVDFSEMIRLQPFELQPYGKVEGRFISNTEEYHLTLHYRIFAGLCLAWVAEL